MINGYVLGLFILGCVSVYALIQSRTNRTLVFFLIPLILSMTLYTWQAVTMLQGKPIMGLPQDQDMEIIYITVRKPEILFLVHHSEEEQATFYAIPWTRENAKKAAKMRKLQELGLVLRGKFTQKRKGNNSESNSLEWEQVKDYSVNNPKNAPQH